MDQADAITRPRVDASSFSVGDTVMAVEGELKDLAGVVTQVNLLSQQIEVLPVNQEITDKIWFTVTDLCKLFKIGDRVKVINGRYSGETGIVVHIEESDGEYTAVLMADLGSKQISVRMKDLSLTNEIATGRDSLEGYEMYDLVATSSNQLGVIVSVGRDDLTLLMQTGEVKTVGLQDLRGKRNFQSNKAMALDAKDNQIHVKDVVTVLEGPMTNHTGSIKHMHRAFLFLHNSSVMENAGIFVVRSKKVALAGQKNKLEPGASHMGAFTPYATPKHDGAAPMNKKASAGRRTDNDILNKTVKIKGGQWKG
jgi:transcription elongation factor SPT5